MKTERKDTTNETAKVFMRDHDAAAFLGQPRRGKPRRRFYEECVAIEYVVAAEVAFGLRGVVTDDAAVLFRLDSLLEERARRELAPPEMLRNRNTGALNRVRVDGRIFHVQPIRAVLLGDHWLDTE